MATAVQPPMVKRKTIIEDEIPASEVGNRQNRVKRPPIFDFLPTISLADWKSGRYQIYLYRYNPVTEKKMAVEKFNEPIDPFSIKMKFGGGSFNIMMKDGPELIYHEDFEIEGDPKISGNGPTSAAPAGTGSDAVAIQAMHMMSNPELMRSMFQMFQTAAMQSMEMMRAQMPQPVDPLATLRNAKEILGMGNQESGLLSTLHVLKELGIVGSPEKKGINEILEIVNTLKGSGLLASAAKPDLTTTLVAVPMLADRLVNGFHEFRLQSESQERTMRMARGEMRPGDPNVITIDDKQPPRQPNPTPAPAAAPQAVSAEMTQQVIMQADLTRLVNAIKQPECKGEDIYDFLYHVWPEMLSEMAKYSKSQLLMFFQSRETQMQMFGNAILYEVGQDPRLPRMIDEFLKVAKENATTAPAPAV